MQVEPAPFSFFEVEGKRIQFSAAAQPDKAVPADLNVGFENVLVLPARDRRRAVRGDYQIILSRVVIRIGDLGLEDEFHTQASRALLQDLQQLDAGNPAKAMAAGGDFVAFKEDVNIVPVAEGAHDFGVGFLIHGLEAVHGLVGKNDSPAERVVGAIAFDYGHVPRRVRFLKKDRKIKSRGTAAQTNDSHKLPQLVVPNETSATPRSCDLG